MRRVGVVVVALLAVLGGACGDAGPLTLPAPSEPSPAMQPTSEPSPTTAPSGTVRAAYPDEPSRFVDPTGEDVAAVDLAALWGLPLFRVDADGQRVPALAASVREELRLDGIFEVEVRLRPGTWSDGTAVTSADVAATVEALRPAVAELGALQAVETPAPDVVRLLWIRRVSGWWIAVDAVGSMLPASVVSEQGLDAWRDGIPVSGGPFRLASREPGRSLTFEANPGSPLGDPVAANVEVLVVPSYETALGLLEDDRVDMTLGHLALNPLPRAEVIPDVTAAAPLGGTTVALQFRDGGVLGGADAAARRREVVGAIRLGELVEGLLGSTGATVQGLWPAGPAAVLSAPSDPAGEVQLVTVLPRGHEVIGFTARSIQRDLEPIDVDMQLVSFETPDFVTQAGAQGDAALRIRRDGPRPLLATTLPDDDAAELGVQAIAALAGEPTRDALAAAADAAEVVPLYRVAAAHAWRSGLSGVEASSWPGLAFTSAAAWRP